MKKIFRTMLVACTIGCVFFILNGNATAALVNENFHAMNNILFYEPGCTVYNGSYIGAEVSEDGLPSNVNERLEMMVETYGELAMELQVEYGLPWELVFAQMVQESGIGTDSSAKAVNTRVWNTDKKYNWLGMKCGGKNALFASGCLGNWSEYDDLSSMIAAWEISYGRNGNYDKAFNYLNPENYDLGGFVYTFVSIYAPAGDGNNNPKQYTSNVMGTIEKVREIAKNKGWLNSEELAKTKNIQIGGNWPIKGDIRSKVKEQYGDTMGLPTGSSVSNSESSCYSSDSGDFPFYAQGDERWGELNYGPSGIDNVDSGYGNIKQAGCGPSSFAMMATALLGKEILPNETSDIAGKAGLHVKGAGSSHDITKILAENYGLEYEDLSGRDNMIEVISQYLKDGWMIHTSGQGSEPFTSGGHYIGIRGITDDGKWLIADSNGQKGKSNTLEKEWDPQDIINAGMKLGNVHAIKNNGSTVLLCNDSCDESGAVSSGNAAKPIGSDLCADSDTIACATGTNFVKVVENAHCGGKQIKINLCEVPNILQGGEGIKVNSRVSGAYYALGERMESLGWKMTANSSFRSYEQQKSAYNKYLNGGNLAAKPGTSNHESGLAVDLVLVNDGKNVLSKSSNCPSSSIWPNVGSDSRWFGTQSKLLCENLADFGLARNIKSEYWHISPTGK